MRLLVGTPGATKPMNDLVQPELFASGIQTEDSDIRAHVSFCNNTVYIFETQCGRDAIERIKPEEADASQIGVEGRTGRGWKVPIKEIAGMRAIKPSLWEGWERWNHDLLLVPMKDGKREFSTSEKGRRAVECVKYVMKHGRFPFWLDAAEDDRQCVQINGTDILVFVKKRVQVKCDARAGITRNLFLQNAERNPLRLY